MESEGRNEELSEETIRLLFDASKEVRDYLSKIVANKPIEVGEEWKEHRAEDFDELRDEDAVEVALSLSSFYDEFYALDSAEPTTQVEKEFLSDITNRVLDEVRDVRQQTTLTPDEFAVYLLSAGTDWDDETIAEELDSTVSAVRTNREDARDEFRTSMRMVDLAERFDDPELEPEFEKWRIYRDPLGRPSS